MSKFTAVACGVLLGVLAACQSAAPASTGPTPPASSSAAPSSTLRLPTPPRTAPAPSESEAASGDSWIAGTIMWTADSHAVVGETLERHVTGTARVVLHVESPYLLTAERGGGSIYEYDYSDNSLCAGSHEKGTLESSAGGFGRTDYSIGILNATGTVGEDLGLYFSMPDWCGGPLGKNVPDTAVGISGFPGCQPGGSNVPSTYAGSGTYTVDCTPTTWIEGNATVTGRIQGSLQTLDSPPPGNP